MIPYTAWVITNHNATHMRIFFLLFKSYRLENAYRLEKPSSERDLCEQIRPINLQQQHPDFRMNHKRPNPTAAQRQKAFHIDSSTKTITKIIMTSNEKFHHFGDTFNMAKNAISF